MKEEKVVIYFRTSPQLSRYLRKSAGNWAMSLNVYLNRLLREDYERVLKVSTDFMERTHKKLSGEID